LLSTVMNCSAHLFSIPPISHRPAMGVGLSQRRQSGGALSLTRMLHSHYQSVLHLNGKGPYTKYITSLKTVTLDQTEVIQSTFLG
jgi:hypothetical protein